MTYAPQPLKDVRSFLKLEDTDLTDNEVGIVGSPSHIQTGTSYHLGGDELIMSKNPYSARTARDKAGLADPEIANAASAIDIDDDLDELRALSVWLVEQCRAAAPDTLDIREIIYSPDGVLVLQWDRERGATSPPQPHSDLSHRQHTHISYYRDSARRSKLGPFQRFYWKAIDMFFGILPDGAMYVCTGITSRYLPPGAYSSTVVPLEAAGVPRIAYQTLQELLDGGGPLLEEETTPGGLDAEEVEAIVVEVINRTHLIVDAA